MAALLDEDWGDFKSISTEGLRSGALLLSNPFMKDPNFQRSAIFLTEYSAHGALGYVLNRPIEINLSDVLPDCDECGSALFYGGPVQLDSLHFVHRLGPELIGECDEVAPGVFWGGDLEILKQMLKVGAVDESDVKFFIGYSGWSAGQLNVEFEENSWIVTAAAADLIFDEAPKDLWRRALKRRGGNFALIANCPKDPEYN